MATTGQKLLAAGTAALIAEPVLALAHTGGVGVIVGLVVGAIAYNAVEDVERLSGREATSSSPDSQEADEAELQRVPGAEKPLSLGYRIFNGKSTRDPNTPQGDQRNPQNSNDNVEQETIVNGTKEDRALDYDGTEFVRNVPASASSPSQVGRFTVEQCVSHTERNSYKVFIGRSLTQERHPAIAINFYKRHIKIIGASQKGKSSMAAAFLDMVARTHDPERIMIALLDMEDQTSKLFTNLPHLACMTLETGETVLLHARNAEQVLEYLDSIVDLMNYRYTLSKEEVAQEPLFIVYLEEFIALKDFFKQKIEQTAGKDKEQAKQNYARLVFCIKEIARRGLKVLVQFLMCAQVDYRDEDLQEALVNVTSGICFCVRATAASAAGFMQTELLNRNAKENIPGQAVVEMPDCRDLILAPEYNLEKLLIAWEKLQPAQKHFQERGKKKAAPIAPTGTHRQAEESDAIYTPPASMYKNPVAGNMETLIYRHENTSVNGSTSQTKPSEEKSHLHLLRQEKVSENEHEEAGESAVTGNVNEQTRQTIKRLADMGIKHNVISKAVRLDGRNYDIYKAVCKEMGIATEKEA